MPTGTLGGSGKALWERVYDASKKAGDDAETAARKAWAAVKSAGWKKNKDGKWVKEKSELAEFSLAIKKASVDPVTGERRWQADTSDIVEDSHGDNMSLELFSDFIQRIESKERPPEEYCSTFWAGGEPYVSISHYPDLDGQATPGISKKTYMDGIFLKAKGVIFNNKLGDAAWKTLKYELEHRSEIKDPVRISIAFLDYEHQHKSTGTIYTRTEKAPFCVECLLAEVNGRPNPKIYRKGHLVHYGMTRVPVNKRTLMEADMTTRVEDAESIVGKELADELEEKASLVGKADLVIKSDGEEPAPPAKPEDEQTTVPAVVVDNPPALTEVVAELTEQVKQLSLLVRSLAVKAMPKEDDETDKCAEGDDDCEKTKKNKMPMKAEIVEVVEEAPAVDPQVALVHMLSEAFAGAMAPLAQKMDILIATQSAKTPPNAVPARRSMSPAEVAPVMRSEAAAHAPGAPMSIGDFARKSVGL